MTRQKSKVKDKAEKKLLLTKQEMIDLASTYEATLRCGNCGFATTYQIPKGKTIEFFIRTISCPNCGCRNTMMRAPVIVV